MSVLLIADCWFSIGDSLPRRSFMRCGHDCGQIISLLQQCRQLACRHCTGFDEQFEPEGGFISLFLNDSNFSDEFGMATGPATGAVIRRHRGAATDDLSGDHVSGIVVSRNRPCQFDDSQGKSFGACFQFGRIHGVKLQTQSAISNQQPAIADRRIAFTP
jgi:hypothetical protein